MKKIVSLLFKIVIVIMSGIGLYINFKLLSFEKGIIYFTIQSNLLCFLFFIVIIILEITGKLTKNNWYYIIKGMITMAITITMFVYQILLSSSDGVGAYTGHMLECNFVHLYVPLLVIFDYIIFGEKGHLKKEYPFYWSFILVAYLVFNVVYVLFGGTFEGETKYPYSYMDVDKLGLLNVFVNCLMVYIFFMGYGTIVQRLDYKLGNIK